MKVCSVCHGSHQNSATCTGGFAPDHNEIEEAAVDLIPGFRLDGLLTSTSSTATYRARDTASGRSCLIKIFTADEKSSQQILREAKVAAGLFHPGIADFYEAGRVDDGRSFVASEDVDGRSLREVLDNVGSPDLLTTIEIIRQGAESLHALHIAGLVHGAINPRNIILSMSSDGRPIVRLQHPDLGRTAQRSIISNRFLIDSEIDSLRYFAPEQCSDGDASVQADIYSLGIVFFEMLSGSPPFDAPTAVALIHQQRNQQPPEVRIENFNLRMLVTHALTEALQKQPRLRQSSANTFARQLRHIEQLATHTSTPPPAGVVPRTSVPTPTVAEPIVVVSLGTVGHTTKPIDSPSIANTEILKADSEAEDFRVSEVIVSDEPTLCESEPSAETIPVPKAVFITPRSRLKVWKRKLRSLATRIAPEAKTHFASILTSDDGRAADQTSIDSSPVQPTHVESPVVRVERRKIQWETPDDDIPPEAAAIEIRANEGLEPAPNLEVAEAERAIESPIVEPSKEKVEISIVEKLPEEKLVEIPVAVKPALIDEKPVTIERPIAKRKLPTPRKTPGAPAPSETPKEKTPAVELAGSVRIVPRMPAADTSRHNTKPQKSSRQRSGLGFKVNLADLEEITLVRPPSKRIRIDWERAVARPDLSNIQPVRRPVSASRGVEFSPTILGGALKPKEVKPDRNDGMFSTFDGSSFSEIYSRRAVILGGGVLALITFLLFGSAFLTKVLQTSSAADSVTASAALPGVTQQISEPATPIVAAEKQRAVTNSQRTVSERPVPEAIPISEKVSRPVKRSTPSEVATEPKTKTATRLRAASSDEGSKTKDVKTESRKRSGDKQPTPALKPAQFTRPRIVKTAP